MPAERLPQRDILPAALQKPEHTADNCIPTVVPAGESAFS
jgi:hypothetical protein